MSPLDLIGWASPVDDTAPAGPNLEFDPDFGALERTAQGEPERQAGNTIVPAKEPDWKLVEDQAAALMQRTRDLRVLSYFGAARLHLASLPAFADVLALIHQLIEGRWDDLHPQLDPEDGNDPTLRATSLRRLADPLMVLRYLRDLPLTQSPRLGRYSWRDISIATGVATDVVRNERQTESLVRAAFQDTDPAFPAGLRAACSAAARELDAIWRSFDAKAGVGTSPDFSELSKLLDEISRFIDRYAVAPAQASGTDDAAAPASSMTVLHQPAKGMSIASLTEVHTRADALRLLEIACQYYRRYEPSSPLPLLLERAQRLAEKDFLEILRDMAPDGLLQAQTVVSGREE